MQIHRKLNGLKNAAEQGQRAFYSAYPMIRSWHRAAYMRLATPANSKPTYQNYYRLGKMFAYRLPETNRVAVCTFCGGAGAVEDPIGRWGACPECSGGEWFDYGGDDTDYGNKVYFGLDDDE